MIAAVLFAVATPAGAADPNKILRVASPDIDTLDPNAYNDDPSFVVLRAIFEGLYQWDYLASPASLSPVTASAPPEISNGGKIWVIHLKPGIYFTDDPAFKGNRRELVADDYVYSLKRWLDPNLRRGGNPVLTDLVIGARAVIDAAKRSGSKMDYDQPMAGLRAIDRYTLRLELTEPNYPMIEQFIVIGAVAREVVEASGADIITHAVGTGPYKLREWIRGSRIVLEANPAYRALRFPESRDPANAALVRSMRGKTLPQIGVIEVNIIEEDSTRLLEFERGRLDYVILRGAIANRLLSDGKVKPEYATRGIVRHVFPEPFLFSFYFNVEDPVVGGMTNERIALRRAIGFGIDIETLLKVVYEGQAIPANQVVPPNVGGHDPNLPKRSLYDPNAARGLLDRFGYTARDSDGFRRRPDGNPLTVTMSLRSGGVTREIATLFKKDMDAIGVRTEFHVTPFQDIIKELENGKFQMYYGGYGGTPSGYDELSQIYGKERTTVNASRFRLPEFDRLMEAFLRSNRDDEQIVLAGKMSELGRAYMPTLPAVFRLENDFVQPWLLGFSPQIFDTYWEYMDIDVAKQRAMSR